MVAIVSGNSLGLNLTSMGTLGSVGPLGTMPSTGAYGAAAQGATGESAYVNAATGNLVVQDADALLEGVDDSGILAQRTYNSLGTAPWNYAATKTIVKVSASVLQRIDVDGSVATYNVSSTNPNLYTQSGGQSGGFNTITVIAGGAYTWTNGTTNATETYSAAGVLQSAKDPLGNVTTYQYDVNGKLAHITGSDGEAVSYTWTSGLLTAVSVTLAGGTTLNEVSYTYDSANRLATVTVNLNADGTVPTGAESAPGYTTTYTYDGTSTRIASITQADGTKTSFTYVLVSGVYKIATTTDGDGNKTSFAYATGSTTTTDPYGVVTQYAYNTTGQLTSVVQGYVASTGKGVSSLAYAYTATGEVNKITDGAGRAITLTYDSLGRLATSTDGMGDLLTLTYNASNQVIVRSVSATASGSAAERSRSVFAAALGTQLRYTLSPEGVVTEYRYNVALQVVSTITYSSLYNVAGLAATAVPTEAQMQTWAATQNLSLIQRQDNTYDLRGELKTTTTYGSVDATGNGVAASASTIQYVYNQAGQLIQAVAPDGLSASHWIYDALGRQVSAVTGSADGLQTSATTTMYDDAHGKVVVTAANGEVTTTAHDAAGRIVSVSQSTASGAQAVTKYTYDADGRLLMTTDATGSRSFMMYDGEGRKAADIDADGNLTIYTYDASNRVTYTEIWQGRVNVAALVDAAGNPKTAWNANPTAAPAGTSVVTVASLLPLLKVGQIKNWTFYDAAGRVAYTVDNYGSVIHTDYDVAGRVADVIAYANAIALPSGTTAPTWSTAITPSAADRRETWIYNRDGQVLGSIDADGFLTRYDHDGSDRLIMTTRYASPVSNYVGSASQPAAVATARTNYSLSGLLPTGPAPGAATNIVTRQYWNNRDQLVGELDANNYLTEFVLDADGRIAKTIRYATQSDLTYLSRIPPLASVRPAASLADQISTVAYDAFGRVSAQVDADGTTTTYGYDAVGNLTQKTTALGTPDQRGLLAQYDVQGRLVRSLSSDGAALLDGTQTTAQVAAIWDQYGTTYAYDAAGRLTSEIAPGNDRTVFFYDDAGQLRFTVDGTGSVTLTTYNMHGQLTQQAVGVTVISAATLPTLVGGLLSASANAAMALFFRAFVYDADVRIVAYDYDQNFRLSTVYDADGNTTAYTRNAFGDVATATTNTRTSTLVSPTSSETDVISEVLTNTVDHRGNVIDQAATMVTVATVTQSPAPAPAPTPAASPAVAGGTRAPLLVHVPPEVPPTVTTTSTPLSDRKATYDAFGRVATSTDRTGATTTYAYDTLGHVVTVTDALGNGQSSTYDAFGRVHTSTDARGDVTTYAYNDALRSVAVTTAEGITTTTTANAEGQVHSITDGAGNTTSYAYDADGNLLTVTSPAGVVTNTYDAADHLLSTTDAAGTRVAYGYDAIGRVLTRTVDPTGLNLQTTYKYDGAGNRVQTTDPRGIVTLTTYDGAGDVLTSTVDPTGLNLTTTYTYDQLGNVLSVTSPAGVVTQYFYDILGRRVSYYTGSQGSGPSARYAYDAEDRVNAVTDANGKTTYYVRDALGRVSYTVDAAGDVSHTVYDAQGNVTEQIQYANRINVANYTAGTIPAVVADAAHDADVVTVYDKDNRARYVLQHVAGDGKSYAVTQLAYDADGRVTSRIQFATALSAATTPTTVSALDALAAGLRSPATDIVARNVFNAAGDLAYSVDSLGNVARYAYDADGRVLQKTVYATPIAPGGDPSAVVASASDAVTDLAYDAAGRLVFTVDPLGNVTQASYDADGNAVATVAFQDPIDAPASGSAPMSASAIASQLSPAGDGDHITRRVFDDANRQVLEVGPDGAVTATAWSADGNVASTTRYATRVSVSTLSALADANGGVTAGQVAGLLQPDATVDQAQAFTYDDAGRVHTRTVNPGGLALVTTWTYDGNGRVVKVVDPRGVATTTAYDPAGNVASTTVDPGGLNLVTTYAYDGLGNVQAVTSPVGNVTRYAYDAAGRLASQVVDPTGLAITTTFSYDADGQLASVVDADGGVTRYVRDADGRVAWTVDAAGDAVHLIRDAFGNVTEQVAFANRVDLAHWSGAGVPPVVADATRDADTVTFYDRDDQARYVARRSGDGTFWAISQVGYDAFGQVTSRVDFASLATASSLPTTLSDWQALAGTLRDFTHDNFTGNLYDAAGRLTWSVDGMGDVTHFVYDAAGRVLQQVQYANTIDPTRDQFPFGLSSTPGTSQGVHTLSMVPYVEPQWVQPSANDRITSFVYDAAGRAIYTVDGLGGVTQAVRDADGNVVETIAYANRIDVPAIDAPLTLAQMPGADEAASLDNRVSRAVYDSAGRAVFAIDALGDVTANAYDRNGNTVAVTQYATAIDPAALPAAASAAQVQALLQPDAAHDRTTLSAYDADDRVAYVVDALGYVTHTTYDGLGQVVGVTSYGTAAGGLGAGATAAAIAAAVHANAALDRTLTALYDGAGNKLASTDALGHTESSTYDGRGQRTSLTDRNGALTTFIHDAAGRLAYENSPSSDPALAYVTTHYLYDGLGNILTRVEAMGTSVERVTNYTYDALNRLAGETRDAHVYHVDSGYGDPYGGYGDPYGGYGGYGGYGDPYGGGYGDPYGGYGDPYGGSAPEPVIGGPIPTDPGRTEIGQTLLNQYRYDAFGDLVATIDATENVTTMAYDNAGRLVFTVDGNGSVTGYDRTAFGDVGSITQYNVNFGEGYGWGVVSGYAKPFNASTIGYSVMFGGGRTVAFAIDKLGRQVAAIQSSVWVTDGKGNSYESNPETDYVYNAFGDVVQTQVLADEPNDVWATTTSYYDKRGQQVAQVDALGYLTTQQFDAVGNRTQVVERANAATGVSLSGYTAPAASPLDRETDYTYDLANRVTRETRVGVVYSTASDGTSTTGNLQTSFTWDAVGNQTSVTDALGNTTYAYYDANGLVVATAGSARTSVLDGRTVTRIPLTTYVRNALGNIATQIDHGAGAASASAAGYTVAPNAGDTTPPDRVTTTTYDVLGRAIQVVDADGQSHYTSYDANGRVAKTWSYANEVDGSQVDDFAVDQYDADGRLIQVDRTTDLGDDATDTYEYDVFGELTAVRTWQSNHAYDLVGVTYYSYDAAGRLASQGGDTQHSVFLYDLQGYRTAVLQPTDVGTSNIDEYSWNTATQQQLDERTTGVQRTDFNVDLLGRAIQVTAAARVDGAGSSGVAERPVVNQSFDRWGNLLTRSDVRNANWITTFAYNANDQQILATQPDALGNQSAASPVTQTWYDALGRQVARRDADGLTSQTWDAANEITSTTRVDGKSQSAAYDAMGNLIESIDFSGNITKFTYDAMGHQVMAARVDDATWSATGFLGVASATVIGRSRYDEAGNLAVDIGATGDVTEYVYGVGHSLVETDSLANKGSLSASYTANGSLPSASASDTKSFAYHDAAGRLEWTINGDGGAVNYQYDASGHLVRKLQAGTWRNSETILSSYNPPEATLGYSPDRSVSELYDDAGRVIASIDGGGFLTRYTYDTAGRVVDTYRYATALTPAQFSSLTDWHGVLYQTFDGPALNALLPPVNPDDIETHSFYDDAGELVGQTDGDGYLTETAYDAHGQVTSQVRHAIPVTAPIGATTTLADIRPAPSALDQSTSNTWDARGRLTSHVDSQGVVTTYAYDTNNNVVQQTVAAGTPAGQTTLSRYDSENRLAQQLPPQGAALITAGMTPAQVEAIWTQYGTRFTYDQQGDLASTQSPGGDRTVYFYDDAGQLSASVGALGSLVAQTRDGTGQVVATTAFATPIDAATLGGLQGGRLSAAGNASAAAAIAAARSATSSLDHVTTYTYDAAGLLATKSDALGTVIYAHNAFGEVRQTILDDAADLLVSSAFDARGNLVSTSDSLGINATATYDAFGRVATRTDGFGYTTRYKYDHDGNLLVTIDPTGDQTISTYDPRGRLWTQTDLHGGVTRYAYDDVARTMTTTTPDGIVYTSTFDVFGHVLSVTDIDGHATTYTYDLAGNLLTTTAPADTVTNTYDAAERLLTTVDSATGIETDYGYDAAGHVLTRTVKASDRTLVTTYAYDAFGNAVTTTDLATGLVTKRTFDQEGNVATVTVDPDGLALTTTYAYDMEHEAISVTEPSGATTRSVYDGRGRLLSRTVGVDSAQPDDDSASSSTTTYTYDADGRLEQVRTDGGNVIGYAYDADGRLEWTIQDGGATQNVYDTQGDVIETIAHASVGTWYGGTPYTYESAQDRHEYNFYDSLGRLTAHVDAEGYLTTTTYNAQSRVTAVVAHAGRIDGGEADQIAADVATARGQGSYAALVPAASADDQSTFTFYDSLGRVSARIDASGMLTQVSYDTAGRVAQTVIRGVPLALAVLQSITPATTLASLAPLPTAKNRSTHNTYDTLGRLVSQTDWQGDVTAWGYDAAGNVVSTTVHQGTADAATTLSRYDLAGRLVQKLSANGAALIVAGMSAADVDAVWQANAMRYDYDGELVSSTIDADGVRTLYYYDDGGRLRYTIDGLGAVTEQTYDSAGRVASTASFGAPIDAAGLAALQGGELANQGTVAEMLLSARHGAVAESGGYSETTYGYDSRVISRVAFAYGPSGTTTAYTYDAFGDLTGVRHLRSNYSQSDIETMAYDRRGQLVKTELDPAGADVTTTTAYDAFGRAVAATDGNRQTTLTTYDAAGRILTVTDPLLGVQRVQYDAFGRVLSSTDARNHTTTTEYDDTLRTAKQTSPENLVTVTTYDVEGRVSSVLDARNQLTQYHYDADGNLKSVTGPAGTVTNFYDGADRLARSTDASGAVAYAYDEAGHVKSRTVDPDGLALRTRYAYDAQGRVQDAIDPEGHVTRTLYDMDGRVASTIVDPDGLALTTRYTYDPAGRVETMVSPDGNLTTYVYDQAGRHSQTIVDPNGLNLVTKYAYDGDGNVVAMTDANLHVTRYVYDADGQVSYKVDGAGGVTHLLHDANGNVTETIGYANKVDLSTWDGTSPPSVLADPARDADVVTVYDKDDRARYTLTHTESDGQTWALCQYVYDGGGNLLSRTEFGQALHGANPPADVPGLDALALTLASQPGNRITTNRFDDAGRMTWTSDALGDVTHFDYDAAGRIVRQVKFAGPVTPGTEPGDVVAGPDDRVTAFVYDTAGRATYSVDALGGITHTVYDADGNAVKTTAYQVRGAAPAATGTLPTAADLQRVTNDAATDNRVTHSVYDNAGRETWTVDAGGQVTQKVYGGSDQAIAVIRYADAVANLALLPDHAEAADVQAFVNPGSDANRTSRAAYDHAGRLSYSIDAGGYITHTTYDGVGNTTGSTLYALQIAGEPIGVTAEDLHSLLDGSHLAAERDQTQGAAYDGADRLLSTTDGENGTQRSDLDGQGRRIATYDANNNKTTYQYDAAGRVIAMIAPSSDPAHPSVTTTFVHDVFGDMLARTEAAGIPLLERTTTFTYDALGRQLTTSLLGASVYDASIDPLNHPGMAERDRYEKSATLVAGSVYDAFGDEVAKFDWATSDDAKPPMTLKTYDKLGREKLEVDPMGFVSQYDRNTFGDVTTFTRYSVHIDADAVRASVIAKAPMGTNGVASRLASTIAARPAGAPADRSVQTEFDNLGRTRKVTTLPPVWVFDGTGVGSWGTATSTYDYDAFGDVVRSAALAGQDPDVWAVTTNYFDTRGLQVATVDPMNYLTTRGFDAAGNLTDSIEYADPATGVSTAGYTVPTTTVSGQNRHVAYTYDHANRMRSQVQVGVAYSHDNSGTTVVGDLVTSYTYDAVGNRTSTTDAAGNTSFSYYDAANRLSAQTSASFSTVVDGTTFAYIPLTTYQRDALGNVVVQTQYGAGAATADASGYTIRANPNPSATGGFSADRVTRFGHDSRGNVTTLIDAGGQEHDVSYDAQGHGVKSWSYADEFDGSRIDSYSEVTYDALGNQTAIITPASTSVIGVDGKIHIVSQATAGSVEVDQAWNAFGEMTARTTHLVADSLAVAADAKHETFDYDDAGRMWRTNSSGGNVTVMLYDLQGRNTAQITSSGLVSSHSGAIVDLSTAADARTVAAWGNDGLRRTLSQLDALGRTHVQTLSARPLDGNAGATPTVTQEFDRWNNVLSQTSVVNANWKTEYQYNWNNQVVLKRQPDSSGALSADSPVTQLFYDQLGRQVGQTDADGNFTGKQYDGAGHLLAEFHADGGVVRHAYDVFGDQVRLTSARGFVTDYQYDSMGRNTAIGNLDAGVFGVVHNFVVGQIATGIWTYSNYDKAGNLIETIDGTHASTHYVFDARGNVIETENLLGNNFSAYNAEDMKSATQDALNNVATWTYNGFGQLQQSKNIGGWTTNYHYDAAQQLTNQSSNYGKNLTYYYDGAGQLTTEVDASDPLTVQTTNYGYYADGNHSFEETHIASGVNITSYQNQTLYYDDLGRLVQVKDLRNNETVQTTYDKVGNTMRITAQMGPTGPVVQDLWFAYDQMNQQVMVDGAFDGDPHNAWNLLNGQGHLLGYDLDGNRISDTSIGTIVQPIRTASYAVTFDESGDESTWVPTVTTTYTTRYDAHTGAITHFYDYDSMDRLSQVYLEGWGDVQTGTQFVDVPINGQVDNVMSVEVPVFTTELVPGLRVVLDNREYDADSREVFSGPAPGSLDPQYVAKLVDGNYDLSGAQSTVSYYDAKGQLFSQHTVNEAKASLSSDTRYTQYDAAGNLRHYESTTGNLTTEYDVDIELLDGYKEKDTIGSNGSGSPVRIDDHYDANGYLVGLTGAAADTRTFVNDADGHVLKKTQNGYVETEWIVNGEVIAVDGVDASGKSVQSFDLSYTPVTNSYPNATTGQYPVQSGDTLESIAQSAYGDSSLWYVIADANGLSDDGDLRVGQVLTVPTKLNGTHNNATTVTPYDPSKIVGSTAPNVPAPPPAKGGCGIVGTIILVIVAVVVTYFTAGAASELIGLALASAGATGAVAAAAAVVVGAAIGGAVGSIASQLVGMAIGQTKGFSWKQVGIAAVSSAFTAGVGGGAGGSISDFGVAVAEGALSNAAAQGVSIALGLQKNFSWRQVAAAGVSSGVGEELGSLTSDAVKSGGLTGLAARSATSLSTTAVSMEIADHGHAHFKDIFAQAAGSVAAPYIEDGIKDVVAGFQGKTHDDVVAADQKRAAYYKSLGLSADGHLDYGNVGRAAAGFFGFPTDGVSTLPAVTRGISSDSASIFNGSINSGDPLAPPRQGISFGQSVPSIAQYFALAGGKGPLNDQAAGVYMSQTLQQGAVSNEVSQIPSQANPAADLAAFALMDSITPFEADVARRAASNALPNFGAAINPNEGATRRDAGAAPVGQTAGASDVAPAAIRVEIDAPRWKFDRTVSTEYSADDGAVFQALSRNQFANVHFNAGNGSAMAADAAELTPEAKENAKARVDYLEETHDQSPTWHFLAGLFKADKEMLTGAPLKEYGDLKTLLAGPQLFDPNLYMPFAAEVEQQQAMSKLTKEDWKQAGREVKKSAIEVAKAVKGTVIEIVTNPKDSVLNAVDGAAALVKAGPNAVAEGATDIAKGYRYAAAVTTDSLNITHGAFESELKQYGEFSGQYFEYTSPSQEIAGHIGEFGAQVAMGKGVEALVELSETVGTLSRLSKDLQLQQAERAALLAEPTAAVVTATTVAESSTFVQRAVSAGNVAALGNDVASFVNRAATVDGEVSLSQLRSSSAGQLVAGDAPVLDAAATQADLSQARRAAQANELIAADSAPSVTVATPGGTWGRLEATPAAQKFAEQLVRAGDKVPLPRGALSLQDLGTLASSEGAEFAVIRQNGERYLVRGNSMTTTIPADAKLIGHVQPGEGFFGLTPSVEDIEALGKLGQGRSAIFNESGAWRTFGPQGGSPAVFMPKSALGNTLDSLAAHPNYVSGLPFTYKAAPFERFVQRFSGEFSSAGFDDAQGFMQGSAASGVKHSGEVLDARMGVLPSDYDVAVVSPKLVQRAQTLGLNVFNGPLSADEVGALGLTDAQNALSASSKYQLPVNFKIYDSAGAVFDAQKTIPFSDWMK